MLRLSVAIVFTLTVGLSSAQAATIVDFTGASTGSLSTGSLSITLADDGLSFNGEISNTSPFDARLTGFGFELGPGNLNGFTGSPDPLAGFDFEDGDLGNISQFKGVELDFGYLTGNNFTGGSPNDGLVTGQSLNFMISGDFTGFTEAQIAAGVLARFQRVGLDGEGSDVASVGQTVVPEPASMVLLGTGLVYLARRKLRAGAPTA